MAQTRTFLVLLLLGAVFGSAFLFMKVLLEEMGPLTLVAGRLILGSIAMLAVMAFRREPFHWSLPLAAKVSLLSALSMVVPFALIAWAEQHIDSGIAAALISTMPLFTAFFAAAVFADERLTLGRLAGLTAGFAGVVTLAGGEVNFTDSSMLGQLAVVGAAASYGAGAVYARALLRSEKPLALGSLELITGTAMALPLAFALEGEPSLAISLKAWGALLALGVAGTGLAFVGYLWLVENAGSVRASLVTYVVPVVGLFLGWAVLDERLGLGAVLGTALIILGVASIMMGRAQTSQRATAPAAAALE